MENGPFEDVFPIKNGDIPASHVSLPEGISDISELFQVVECFIMFNGFAERCFMKLYIP